MKTQAIIVTAFSLALGACSSDGKGSEEDIPQDGKADSFRNPTVHGNIQWGETYKPTFSEDKGFYHAFDFSLQGEAEVTLETKRSSKTMDTVMYLYKYDIQQDSWGSYIAKNDDKSGRTRFSFLKESLRSGQYRVMLKPYRKSEDNGQGTFKFLPSCEGTGCVNLSNGLPPSSSKGSAQCVSAITETLESNTIAEETIRKTVAPGDAIANEYDLVAQLYFESNKDNLEYILDAGGTADFYINIRQTEYGASIGVSTSYEREATYLFDLYGHLLIAQHTWEGEGDVSEYYCQTYEQGTDGDWVDSSECGVVIMSDFPTFKTLVDDGYLDSNYAPAPVDAVRERFNESFPATSDYGDMEYELYQDPNNSSGSLVELYDDEGDIIATYAVSEYYEDFEVLWYSDAVKGTSHLICDF